MAFPILAIWKAVSKLKLLKTISAFLFIFFVLLIYFNCSEFTSWWTSTWISFSIAFVFTIGVSLNVYLRCGALVFVVQCFSHFGLFMMFVSVSWIILQEGMSSFVHNHRVGFARLFTSLGPKATHFEDKRIENLSYVLGVLHYSIVVPFSCIYVYGVLYEITYKSRRVFKKTGRKLSKGKLYTFLVYISRNFMSYALGAMSATVLVIFYMQSVNHDHLVARLEAHSLSTDDLNNMSASWIAFYLSTLLLLIVLMPFSKVILKFRHHIIKKFLKSNSKRRGEHIYIVRRPRKKRKHGKKRKATQTDTGPDSSSESQSETTVTTSPCSSDGGRKGKKSVGRKELKKEFPKRRPAQSSSEVTTRGKKINNRQRFSNGRKRQTKVVIETSSSFSDSDRSQYL